jgi:hypothetical protein
MYKTQRKTSKGLLGLLIACGVITVLDLVAFFILAFLSEGAGDAEFSGLSGVISYHIGGIGKLFTFTYGASTDIGGYALSILLYALIVCTLIFTVWAILVAKWTKRRIMWWSVAIVVVDLVGFIGLASGTVKYWQILNGHAPYAGQTVLVFLTAAILILGVAHFVCSMASYFWSIVEAFKNPRIPEEELEAEEEPAGEEETKEEEPEPAPQEQEPADDHILINSKPRKMKNQNAYIVQNFYGSKPQKKQPKAK